MAEMMQVEDHPNPDKTKDIEQCVENLEHASYCGDSNCSRDPCPKWKRIFKHLKACEKRKRDECKTCKQVTALCCYHAKKCVLDACDVPFCYNIRQKLNKQKKALAAKSSGTDRPKKMKYRMKMPQCTVTRTASGWCVNIQL